MPGLLEVRGWRSEAGGNNKDPGGCPKSHLLDKKSIVLVGARHASPASWVKVFAFVAVFSLSLVLFYCRYGFGRLMSRPYNPVDAFILNMGQKGTSPLSHF